jgi:beta-N-acetylhexosaminidase
VDRRTLEPLVRASLRTAILAGALLLATVPPGTVAATAVADPHVEAARDALARLPLADRAAQVLMTSVPGTTLDERARTTLAALRPGGVIVFGANYRSRAQLTRYLRTVQVAVRGGDAQRSRALVSIDQEGGIVKRIPDAPPTRSHPQLGAADRTSLTRTQARATADALAALGISIDLAPVGDLDLGPRHVMRERSFGSNPALVARHVAAFVEGLQAGNVSATVKHFPGFGGASVNSDDALATITRTRAQLDAADLQAFRSAFEAGTDSVMLSHGVYTRIDRLRPASTSPAMYRLLRSEFGYEGVAITDSLHAAGFGAATGRTIPQGCVLAIAAGADIALLTGSLADAVACRRALVGAVRAGTLSRERLDEAALRVLVLKSRRGLLPASVR